MEPPRIVRGDDWIAADAATRRLALRLLVSDTGSHACAAGAHTRASTKAGVGPLLMSDPLLASSMARRDVEPLVVVADDAEDLQIGESGAASASESPRCASCIAGGAGNRAMRPALRGKRERRRRRGAERRGGGR
jgi:hypothetical protein